uniref:7TM_GPCR_Srx domain-containing protein n=1 Tax=Onchocerca volvulus TaxID=6282 RepID=A0A8R1XTB0_ONCVO
MIARSFYMIVLFLILNATCQDKNTTNKFDIRDEHHKVAKYIAILLFTILLLYSIISNILMAIALFCGGKDNSYSRAFVLIALQLIISNLIYLLPQMFVILPELLQTPSNPYSNFNKFAYVLVNQTTWMNYRFSRLFASSYISILQFSFLLTLNRFVAIILPEYNAFFKSARLYFLIILVWLSVLAFSIIDYYYCTRRFLIWNLTWEMKCGGPKGGNIFWSIRFAWTLFIPNIMFVMYVTIFYNICRKQRFSADINQNQRNRKMCANRNAVIHYEWPILIQAAWNCGVLEIQTLSFNFLSSFLVKIFDEGIYIPSRIFINSYVILVCAVLPTVHFIYSKKALNILKHYLYFWFHRRTAHIKNDITTISVKINAGQL